MSKITEKYEGIETVDAPFGNLFVTITKVFQQFTAENVSNLFYKYRCKNMKDKNDKGYKSYIFINEAPVEDFNQFMKEFNDEYSEHNSNYKIWALKYNKYIIKNYSTAPELINGEIKTGGVVIIVKYNEQYYFIGVKDYSKSVITAIGGTASNIEDKDPNNTFEVMVREYIEETSSPEFEQPASFQQEPILIAHHNMTSTYYGITDINDNYYLYLAYFEFQTRESFKNKDFLYYLFNETK